uniref:EF-hand domain-containing protein n=1 Tax=Bursaphelenchus xylophilus TaxID=6326 RepID=A0A1I7SRM1_BURXY
MFLAQHSFGGNFLDHLRESRVNEAHVQEVLERLGPIHTKLSDDPKARKSATDETIIPYREWRRVYKSMPAFFRDAIPVTLVQSAGNLTLSKIEQVLKSYCEKYDSLEALGYRDVEEFKNELTYKELDEFIQNEMVKNTPFYKDIKDNEYVRTNYESMVRLYLEFLLPSRCPQKITVAEVIETGITKKFRELETTKVSSFEGCEWVNINHLIHLNEYFRFLSEGKEVIEKDRFKICRHYKDYEGSSLYFNNNFEHARAFTDVFIDRLFEVLVEDKQITEKGMDFKAFMRFQLMLDHKKAKKTLEFFFNIYDLRGTGRITYKELEFFFNGYFSIVKAEDFACLKKDFLNTAILLVKRGDPGDEITLNDILECAKSEPRGNLIDLFVMQLAGPDAFFALESRMDGGARPADDTQVQEDSTEEPESRPPDDLDFFVGTPLAEKEKLNSSI